MDEAMDVSETGINKLNYFRVSLYKSGEKRPKKLDDTLFDDDYPSLCILSENKKKIHMEKVKNQRE